MKEELRQIYVDEEIYWKQKSRNRWLREGDGNTKFFHAQTKQRRAQNRIVGLFDKTGKWLVKDKEIIDEATGYFSELFTTTGSVMDVGSLAEIQCCISKNDSNKLLAIITEAEIKEALFNMDPGKTLGPDGMTTLFFL